jgi:hypothetical protein
LAPGSRPGRRSGRPARQAPRRRWWRRLHEGRLAKLELSDAERPKIAPDFEEVTEGEEVERKEGLKSKWAQLAAVVGSERRLRLVAADLVDHFEKRLEAMDGKAMVVTMSRRIALELYREIVALRPKWAGEFPAKQGTALGISCHSELHSAHVRHALHHRLRQRALAAALDEAGIRYVSARALGAPKPLRAIAADDWAGFAAGYRERLALAREELEQLVPLVASERVCLLCFEADPKACHRSLLAHEIQRLLDVAAVHLRPGRADEPDDHERLMALGEVAHHQVEVAAG